MSGVFRNSIDETSNAPETELLGGTDQSKIGNVGDRLKVDALFLSPPAVTEQVFKTFQITVVDVATANNKSLISIENTTGSTVKIKIREIKITTVQNSAVTGVTADLRLFRATSHTAGTLVTPLLYDTTDTLSSSVTVRTGATMTGTAAAAFFCWKWSTDEWAQGSSDVESFDHTMQTLLPAYSCAAKTKPVTLNAAEALTIDCKTNTTTGLFCIQIIFTEETT